MIEWSETLEPCEECRYHHVKAETVFGSFLITWKGWKAEGEFGAIFDETPWGDFWSGDWVNVGGAKAAAEAKYKELLESELARMKGAIA